MWKATCFFRERTTIGYSANLTAAKRPTFQGDAFFYFPLSDITDMQGMLFTNITDEEMLADLTDIIEKSGRSMEAQTYGDSGSNIFEVVKKMFVEDFVSRSMLFAFLGLVFCAVFAVSMLYRESNRYMMIHHLYGATYFSPVYQTACPSYLRCRIRNSSWLLLRSNAAQSDTQGQPI